MPETLEARLKRLALEREEADRRYNDALTALDRAIDTRVGLPPPPPLYDASKLPEVNESWDILPGGTPAATGTSLKGRLQGFIWRQVGPALDAQRHFNATLVDHLNRNVAGHEQAQQTTAALIAALTDHLTAQQHMHTRLVALLQTVTAYIDTKNRAEVDILNAGLSGVAETFLKRAESVTAREERLARGLAAIDDVRQTAAVAQQTALALKRDVERLLQGGEIPGGRGSEVPGFEGSGGRVDLDAFKYLGFEDRFRGSIEGIRQGLSEYVPYFAGTSDVLDVGCGRGEFLDLLRSAGVRARGLDVNQAMVEASRARGLEVVQGDALGYLASLDDASLGGLFAAQVVEHLSPDYLSRLLDVAAHKIRPGGIIVLETINPACWLAFFESYLRDLSHVRPIHPETLQFLLQVSGFQQVEIRYRSPVADAERLQPVPPPLPDTAPALADLAETFNENMARLNARMFTFQDYAVIGRR